VRCFISLPVDNSGRAVRFPLGDIGYRPTSLGLRRRRADLDKREPYGSRLGTSVTGLPPLGCGVEGLTLASKSVSDRQTDSISLASSAKAGLSDDPSLRTLRGVAGQRGK
jgi:hypothetical protein